MTDQPEKKSKSEAGRMGGQKTRDRHGAEHYREIGRKGGRRLKGEKADEILEGRSERKG